MNDRYSSLFPNRLSLVIVHPRQRIPKEQRGLTSDYKRFPLPSSLCLFLFPLGFTCVSNGWRRDLWATVSQENQGKEKRRQRELTYQNSLPTFPSLGFWITLEPGGYSLRNQAKGMLEVLRLAVCSEFDSRVSVRPSKLWTPNREYLLKTHSLLFF